ncbi:MAG TPA: serine/threonine-protein kinase [Gemmataceae bacterium]|nr:serine/threonine-protein kinase [Gemmataceae bacterium]
MTSPIKQRPRLSLHPGAEPLPGCRLIELVGEGGFGEVWKCQGLDGRIRAFKAVRDRSHGLANDGPDVGRELRAVTCVRSLQHPLLLAVERAEIVEGALLLVMEWADESLSDQLQRCRDAGRIGLPREPLLAWLSEAAEVLDLLNQDHGLAHLDVKPHNLLLAGGRAKVADFGLVSRLNGGPSLAPECRPGVVSPLYASPEAFRGEPSPASDQYSLALAFHELLTGALPFAARNVRQLVLQHALHEPNLDRLPEADRPIVARALAKDPPRRFPSCTDFVRALAANPPDSVPVKSAFQEPASYRVARRGLREEECDVRSVMGGDAVPTE